VAEILGVVNDVAPVRRAVPPIAAAYQSTVSPAPGVAEMIKVPVSHRELPIPAGGFGAEFTVSTAEHELWHPFAFVTVTVYVPAVLSKPDDWADAVKPEGPFHE
jgi:hypothetical protein